MELKKEQYEQIAECFPKQRKPAKISNLDVLNAALYVMENGCKWRSLPKEYGDWHVIYVQINFVKGVLEKIQKCTPRFYNHKCAFPFNPKAL